MIEKATLSLGENRVVTITCSDGISKIRWLGSSSENTTSNEAYLVAWIARAMELDSSERPIPMNLNPEKEAQQFEVIKCQWTEHGYLHIVDESPETKFRHAETPQEAIKRRRNFTCTRAVHSMLPKKRMVILGRKR